jgi:tRNA (guanine-N7-)-methyltransferase
MRQRTIRNIHEKIKVHHAPGSRLVTRPMEQKGKWQDRFVKPGDLCLELGCGKGQFLISRAGKIPEKNFIGVEGQPSVLYRALEKTGESSLDNLCFIEGFVRDPMDYFASEELSAIYLNFSDPWPKARHSKRRLTSPAYLKAYQAILREGGTLEIKTDNRGLYEYTLEIMESLGMEPELRSEDLHGEGHPAACFTTEYEDKFRKEGKGIFYIRWTRNSGASSS